MLTINPYKRIITNLLYTNYLFGLFLSIPKLPFVLLTTEMDSRKIMNFNNNYIFKDLYLNLSLHVIKPKLYNLCFQYNS